MYNPSSTEEPQMETCSNTKEDIVMAIRYIINSMHQIGLLEFATAFEDLSLQIENYSTLQEDASEISEQKSLLSLYMSMKYAKKITLDKHKKTALTEIRNILTKNENTL